MHARTPHAPAPQSVLETVRGMSPSVVRQMAPVVEQLAPIYLDLAQGRMEFSPSPEEARRLIQTYYSAWRVLAPLAAWWRQRWQWWRQQWRQRRCRALAPRRLSHTLLAPHAHRRRCAAQPAAALQER